jgi:hypothetical protein
LASAYEIIMLKPADNPIDSTDFPARQTVARQREPAIVLLILALFAGGVAICAALMVPILWTAVTEAFQRPAPTYQQCGAVKEDAARLACFDRILRQNSLHYLTKDAPRMNLGEIFAGQLNRPGRDDSVTQQ